MVTLIKLPPDLRNQSTAPRDPDTPPAHPGAALLVARKSVSAAQSLARASSELAEDVSRRCTRSTAPDLRTPRRRGHLRPVVAEANDTLLTIKAYGTSRPNELVRNMKIR